jgi:hypothetical protein
MIDKDNSNESPPGERTPFKDLTNNNMGEITGKTKSTSRYVRLSAEKKEEYRQNKQIARQKKKAAPLNQPRQQGMSYQLSLCCIHTEIYTMT